MQTEAHGIARRRGGTYQRPRRTGPATRARRACLAAVRLVRLVRLPLIVVLLVGLSPRLPGAPRTVAAHPLGLTRILVTLAADRSYTIDILVDPESLLAKLEILADRTPSGAVPLDQLPDRIRALRATLLAQTQVMFDDERCMPGFAYVPGAAGGTAVRMPGSAPTAVVRLSGRVPAGAKTFHLNYGLVLGSYAMTVRHDPTAPPVEAALAAAAAASSAGAPSPAPAARSDEAVTLWVAGGQDSPRVDVVNHPLPSSRLVIAWRYFVLGFEHILPKGIDHILFVLGIFLLSGAWRPMLLQVTAFTVAHSITLALTMYGVVSLPSSIVEPLIALSITYVAIENLWTTELKPWRLLLVFGFGLLHGMGFAGVLSELGLPRSEFLTALVTFNLGVEAGQLAVIGIALAVVGWWRQRDSLRYRRMVVVPASLLIALIGAYWTVTRAMG